VEPADGGRDDREGALQELLRASRAQRTGQLFFATGGQVKGSIVLHQGRVAWAVSADHQEDLGTFLWRLGRVSKDEIAEVRRKYEKNLGARKLGSLLEEEGLITRAALRRCLLLHTRMVVTAILARRDLEVSSLDITLEIDPEMAFELAELLPELLAPEVVDLGGEAATGGPPGAEPRVWPWRRRRTMITGFDQVEGFIGAAVVSADGELLAADGRQSEFDPAILGFFVASALGSVGRVASSSLGAVGVVCFELDHGTLVARWVNDHKDHVVLMLLEPRAPAEPARYVLDAAALSISRVIAHWNDRGWASPLPSTTGQW
jgi:hypothetical protein